ncbi:MAG: hypothetical protein M9903_02855 [Saprospiraceae bacterium]|nr:hypothetical protein [Candidatus Parvibacillus calidus]MBX2937095.1 hypothetical protein [Saprospiraceae bacterium]MCO5282422.1 hypothetical protein [Saprospiraceae bacterium]
MPTLRGMNVYTGYSGVNRATDSGAFRATPGRRIPEQITLHSLWHCRTFHFGIQVLSSCFDRQKTAIHPPKKIGIHPIETQSIIIRSR